MHNLLITIKEIVSSKYYMIPYVVILLFGIIQGNILAFINERKIKKVLTSKYEQANKYRIELMRLYKLNTKQKDFYDSVGKYQTYLLLGIFSFFQLVGLFITNADSIAISICSLTMTISFLEFRDNRKASNIMKNTVETDVSTIVSDFVEYEAMVIEDIGYDFSVKENYITEAERIALTKKQYAAINKLSRDKFFSK